MKSTIRFVLTGIFQAAAMTYVFYPAGRRLGEEAVSRVSPVVVDHYTIPASVVLVLIAVGVFVVTRRTRSYFRPGTPQWFLVRYGVWLNLGTIIVAFGALIAKLMADPVHEAELLWNFAHTGLPDMITNWATAYLVTVVVAVIVQIVDNMIARRAAQAAAQTIVR